MAFQSQNLVMIGLGVLDDVPPNAIQPPLPDGIHLRWNFAREKGLPWHGYYLFRRRHRPGKLTCLTQILREMQLSPGQLGSRTLHTPRGQISSDRNLHLSDLFPPPGLVEFDLTARRYLRFTLPPGEAAYQARVTVGFLLGTDSGRVCMDFATLDEEPDNPFVWQDVVFEVFDHDGGLWSGGMIGTLDGRVGLNIGFETHIKLPCPATMVSLSLGHGSIPVRATAIDGSGSVVDTGSMSAGTGTLVLRGTDIVELVLNAPQNEAFLFELCYVCGEGDGEKANIEVRALSGAVPVDTERLSGLPGQVVSGTLSFDSITAVEFSGGPAAVIDVCWTPIDAGALRGWEILPDFTYPLCLPVAYPDYPCTNKPATQPAAENLAAGRVRYGDPNDWRGAPFDDLHGQLKALVAGGPPPGVVGVLPTPGAPMADRFARVPGVPAHPDGSRNPDMRTQYPLDLVMVGALNAPIAQMVGLYWVDRTVDPALAYDYLIMADHKGVLGGDPAKALSWLVTAPDFGQVDGFILFNQRLGPGMPLDPPTDFRAYALPGSTRVADDGTLVDASNNAGLRWDLGRFMEFLLPGKAVMYHLWRASLGMTQPAAPTPPPAGSFDHLTTAGPIMVVEPQLPAGKTPTFPADWPQHPLHAIDSAVPEGWYSYRVNGIDIFGRHSPHSAPARWFQWAPAADPRPWYYTDPPGDTQVHPYAVGLLDKVAPPPPTAIEAYALDPEDPMLVRDAAYNAWRASLTPAERDILVGLRVRWQWTFRHSQQAPDAQEFRIYYQPGRLNALMGSITAVSAASPTESLVETDIANPHAAGAFVDAVLRVGGDGFRVLTHPGGTPLRLRVANLGPDKEVQPRSGAACSVVVPETNAAGNPHPLHVDYTTSTNWEERIHVVSMGALVAERIPPTRDAAGEPLMGNGATATGATVALNGDVDLSTVSIGDDYVFLHNDAARANRLYAVLAVNDAANTLTVDAVPALGAGPSPWTVGPPLPLRQYEVFLPASGGSGLPLAPTLADPIAYAHVGVSTADDKTHTADAAKWTGATWGDRSGNEGRVGGRVTIFRVRRTTPQVPVPPPDTERVFATPADYHGRSYYTCRWQPSPHLKTHIFRALDDAVFKADWAHRASASPTIAAGDEELFPVELRGADPGIAARRGQIAAEINQLNGFGHDPAGTQAAMVHYRGLSNDGLRVLAGLSWVESAFTQITALALDPTDPALANRVGPDNAPDFPIDAGLRIYIDTLDGRSTNRYLYRAAYVDGAHNRSANLSLSSPPVYLPNVVPPRTPVLTKALGGDREITLRWASNREADLVAYRVYRTADEGKMRDIRLMDLVHTVTVPAGDPALRPAEVSWTDSGVPGLAPLYYRLAAVDEAGNVSPPTDGVVVQAFDDSRPAPPTWGASNPVASGQELNWALADAAHRPLVQRQDPLVYPPRWDNLTSWLPAGAGQVIDTSRANGRAYRYRIKVQDGQGRTNRDFNELEV